MTRKDYKMKPTTIFKTMTLTIAAFILVVVVSVKPVASETATDHCAAVANVAMALATLRDQGMRADVVYEYLVSTENWTTEQARVVVYTIYVLKRDVSPSDLGAEAFVVCMKGAA